MSTSSCNGQSAFGAVPKATAATQIPIAVCGMALRLPGGLTTPQQFWEFLLAKGDARCRVPKSRYNVSAYYSPEAGKPSSVNTEYGYYLDESVNLASFDASFWNIPRREVERVDPHQRQLLEVVRECMEDAGETGWRGSRIGCYFGSFGEDWCEMFAKETQHQDPYRVFGFADFMLANRISYEMDLKGPSMSMRTACSASLAGLHEACLALSRGDCSAAIVGGASLILAPGLAVAMTDIGVLSPDGSCKSFSADANGYARGEGINAVFIKPLEAALKDGNPVRAVIRATAFNTDGRTPGVMHPSADAHEALMRRAYEVAGISDVSQTAFVECHGTGTVVGDPTETTAVGRVFGPTGGIYITSVKPNMGHSEGASGITSLIKAVLSLEHLTIPPNIKFTSPNPAIPFHSAGLVVPVETTPWPNSRAERVSVNSFGIGGSNSHVIVDSASSFGAHKSPSSTSTSPTPQLLVYSANTQDSLQSVIDNYRVYLEENPDNVENLSYTLCNRREHLAYRAFSVAWERGQGNVSAALKSTTEPPAIIMVFTGQGAQWAQMGCDLMRWGNHPIFRETIEALDKHLQSITILKPDWSLKSELLKSSRSSRINTALISQPACTAVQIALVDILASLGIKPAAVVGHSSGEIAAAYAVGSLTAKEAITVAFYRGVVATRQTKPAAMAAVGLNKDDVREYLIPGVVVACENSPKSVTLSGDSDKVKKVVFRIQDAYPDSLTKLLKVDRAYHSLHMAEVGQEYYSLIEPEIICKSPTLPFFSSVVGKALSSDMKLGGKYWQDNFESTVLFHGAVDQALQHPIAENATFLEIGPHSALAGPLRQIQESVSRSLPYTSTMLRNQNCIESLLTAVGRLHLLSIPVDFTKLVPSGSTLPDLPRYPWNHSETYWYESRLSKEWRQRSFHHHDLLGIRVAESTEFDPSWRNIFHLDNVPWVRDHKIKDDIVFPFAGYVSIAGEAIRQLTGIQVGFNLRHVHVSTAMVLSEAQPVEIATLLRRYRLTDSLDSQWWEFTISSHNGHAWTKNCTGQVAGGSETIRLPSDLDREIDMADYPRKVASRQFFASMGRAGLNYGPEFRCLEEIQTGTMKQIATAQCSNNRKDKANYHIHPTLVDSAVQLLAAAATKGCRTALGMILPTRIESMSLCSTSSDVRAAVSASFTGRGAILGEAKCYTADGNTPVLSISGMRLSITNDEEGIRDRETAAQTEATARVHWGPHIDFIHSQDLIKPSGDRSLYTPALTRLSHICFVYSQRRLEKLTTRIPHMRKFQAWINRQANGACSPDMDPSLFSIGDDDAMEQATKLVDQLSATGGAEAATAMYKILTNISSIFSGETEALELLLADDTLTKLYDFMDECDRSLFLQHLTHSKPNLRILEIGAGTGATTASILKDLVLPNGDGQALYSRYTYTDISTTFFVAARERFKAAVNMEFIRLDISQDPAVQGFEGRQYDLILATNVIHATPSLQASLRHIRSLLAPDGRLLLLDLASQSKWVNYVFGTLEGWWYGEADGRVDEPYVSTERWTKELVTTGFQTPEAIILDAPAPFQLNALIVARPEPHTGKPLQRNVTVLYDQRGPGSDLVVAQLEKRGYTVHKTTLNETCDGVEHDIVALLDQDRPFFEDIGDRRFTAFKNLVSNRPGNAGIFWVTQPCQVQTRNPRYAQVLGLARTIRSELSVDFATCEVDDLERSADVVADVFVRFHNRENNGGSGKDEDEKGDIPLQIEYEYAVHQREVLVSRYLPFSLSQELLTWKKNDRITLETGRPGWLSSLHWRFGETTEDPLESDAVEVEIYCSGLNFRDVLGAMGVLELSKGSFGLEGAGVVRRTGPQAQHLTIGDRVMFIGRGTFSTLIMTSESRCVKIPENLNFQQAATMPCVYATAIYSLFNIAGLRKGQTILIHSACGGVGLAAIQLSRMVKADIYVTVGNEEKVNYLMNTFGLPRTRIFNSRNISFVEDIMRETRGEGVDVVLNSLSGELLHASWHCVAPFGTMVEIGKRDAMGAGKLDMDVFLENRSYCCVDLDQICLRKPSLTTELMQSIVEFYNTGHIQPIQPIKVFSAASVQEAFRYMQQGLHMGKIVISIRDSVSQTIQIDAEMISKRQPVVEFDGSAYYLLVGGLGGVGRAVSTWMVEQGARHLIFLSRTAGNSAQQSDFIHELESMGCTVHLVRGSVTSSSEVERAVSIAPRGQLKGILQMPMALCDKIFHDMSLADWEVAVAPKVRGTWNLHRAAESAGVQLDFFVLFASLGSIIGHPGQANYAAANTFQDAFAQWRGGSCSVIDFGAIVDIGYVANNVALARHLKESAGYTILEKDVIEAMAAAMRMPMRAYASESNGDDRFGKDSARKFVVHNQFVTGLATRSPLLSPHNKTVWRKDVRMAAYHNQGHGNSDVGPGSESSNDVLKSLLGRARVDAGVLREAETANVLAVEIGRKLFAFLLKPADDLITSRSLADLGMDSLVANELRNWWRHMFGFEISALEMLGMGTLDALGERAAEGLIKAIHGEVAVGNDAGHTRL